MTDNPFNQPDIADRARAIRESIASKQSLRPKVDANGNAIGKVIERQYDEFGALLKTDPPAA